MKKEIYIFFTALIFFTRIPCPKWVKHDPSHLYKSSKYLPLIGIIVGSIGAITFYLSHLIFSIDIAIILSIFSTIYTTGGFHEDGFADVCDGFGGGWTKDKILSIMKDSTLGTYGVLGLLLILGLKFSAIREITPEKIIITIISAHALSRFIATSLLYTHEYVRDTETSKVKPTSKKLETSQLIIAAFIGFIPLLAFKSFYVFLIFIPAYISKILLGIKFKKWIGGQTGDCAGAVQQVSEVVIYLSFIILWKFI